MFDIMTMAENIKTYRNKRGLNQYEFAEKLGISPQAVSKWECGLSCPSVENLCVISEILDVSIDTLIGENSDSEKMMIGIDGGGTKTEFVLFSESGRILNRIVLDGCNPNTVGMEEAMNILQLGIDTLMKIKGKISGIFVGAAGLDSGNNTSKIKKMLKEKYPKVKIQCDLKHFGGRGYLLDKGGSGYHIGRDAICAAQDARDGIGEHTILTDLVEEKLGNTVWESIQDIYSKNQSYIASFTPCVFLAYENGDKIAEQILKNNAACLAELINFAVDHYDIGKYVVASGGILKQKPAFREMLKEMLHPDIELDVPDYPPVYGACIMCCLLCGVDTKPVKERFMMSYDSYQ